jgi:hypothetical protein
MSVTDDQIRSRGKEQYTDHSSQGKKEGNASQRVCLFRRVFTLIVNLVFLALLTFPPYPSVHILHTSLHSGGRLFYISVVYRYNYHSRSTLSIIACSCLSHTISHININPSQRSYISIYSTYRSGTDTFLSYYITSPSHQS